MNYTKGEWKVTDSAFSRFTAYRGRKQGGRTFVTTALNLNQIAEAQGDTQEEAEANAHLIAAAPDMYEALKEIRAGLSLNRNNELAETLRYVIGASIEISGMALAKAETGS